MQVTMTATGNSASSKSFVLIEMVQAEECLWDMRCASYHDRNRKQRVIEEIAGKLELPGKYVILILETTRFVEVTSTLTLNRVCE